MPTRPGVPAGSSPPFTSRRCRLHCLPGTGSGRGDAEPINAAFATGDVERALSLTPDELADRTVLAGSPDDWVAWLSGPYAEAGFGHALVSFADPDTVTACTGRDADGVPDLVEQIRLVGHEVLPVLRP
jgi:hypothetical protein